MRKRYTSVHMLVKDFMRTTDDWSQKSFGSKSVSTPSNGLNQLEGMVGCNVSKARSKMGDTLFHMVLASELMGEKDSQLCDIIENINDKFINDSVKFRDETKSKVAV